MTSKKQDTFSILSEQSLLRLPDAVVWIDEYGNILRVNAHACQLYGYTAGQFRRMSVFDLNPQLSLESWQEHWRKDRHKPTKIQTIHQKADGKTIPVEVVNCWEEIEGTVYSCSICRDISDRKHREQNLKRLWEQSRQLDRTALLSQFSIDRTDDAVLWLCPKGKIKFVNKATAKRLEYEKDVLVQMDIFDINPLLDQEKLDALWTKLRKSGHVIFESVHRSKTGRDIVVEINMNYILHEGKEYSCSIARDITERKKQEERLRQALDEIKLLKEKIEAENLYLHQAIKAQEWSGDIITNSDRMRMVLNQLERVAPTNSTVLILGESGTGKELIANAVHRFSRLSEGGFIKVNCAALPEHLIESELFGHEKGAFTGAFQRKIGKFELADGGTLFLDEIGELPLGLQAKLLRVLQEGTFERLGGNTSLQVNVRIVAATNRDLEKMVGEGTFRNDLYFRLFVFPIVLPPLRDRKEDIPLLVQHFCEKYQRQMGKIIKKISPDTMARLKRYDFPGNIRELENIVERGIIMSTDQSLKIGDWFKFTEDAIPVVEEEKIVSLKEVQRNYIVKVLQKTNWRVSGKGGAASYLDLPPTTLRSKMQKLGIRRSNDVV